MIVLLDTCTFLWALSGLPPLPPRVADLVRPARVRRAPLAGGVFPRAISAQAGRTDAQRGETRRGVTDQSSSVEMSPGFCPSSLAFNTRRMILPERVLGSEGTISIS